MTNNAHILLVDDSPETIDPLDSRLRALGYRTTIVRDGAAAIEAVRASPPDLVMLDIAMPDVNGYQACREIRKLHKKLPILMLTAKSSAADKFWAMEAGADEFVSKPVDPQALVHRIAGLLGRG